MKTVACCALLASWFWANPVVHGAVILVKEGQDPCPIYTAAGKDAAPDVALARDLAAYLEKLSGAKFPVRTASQPLPERGIFVGPVDPSAAAGLAPDDFRIRAAGQRLDLVGGSRQGTAYGAFALLEQLGCRWWSESEEDLPAPKTALEVPEGDRVTRPPFAIHNVWNREAQSSRNRFAAKARTTSFEHFNGGHTLYPLLTPYGAGHPEIYPMDKQGRRKANDLHLCYLAPGIAEALAEALEKEVERRHGDVAGTIYFAGMGDWYGGMCECPQCRPVYEEETWTDPDGRKKQGYTATLLRMINRTAEILGSRHPGIRVGTFAYMSLEAPPAKTVPRENVVIRVPRLRHCTVHPAEVCDKNRSYLRNLERWCQVAPGRVYVWEYGASFRHFLCPFPCLYSMAENLKLYHRLGIKGVEIQGNYNTPGGDLAVLKNYVWRTLFWEPGRDPRELVDEFCRGYYGPAAAAMRAYVETLEKSVREPALRCADEFADCAYLTLPVRAEMARHRQEALARAAGQQPYDRRVREGTVGLEALDLWRPGPLQEQGDRLIRKDLGADTLARAEELLEYIRGAAPNEWSSGRAAHLAFLTLQGGPLVKLVREPLTVKVAPLLAGQIRQISFRGQDLLYVENNSRAKGYPVLGGSIHASGTRLMKATEPPSSTCVKMTGESGIGAWSGNTKQEVSQTVELPDPGAIVVTAAVHRVVKSGSETRSAAVSTVYATGKQPGQVQVEYRDPAGTWQPVSLATAQMPLELPALSAIRIRLPAQGCVVVDQYLAPAVSGAKLNLDEKQKTLSTTVQTAAVDAPLEGEAIFLRRRIEVQPLPGP